MDKLSLEHARRIETRNFNRFRFDALDKGKYFLPWCLRPCKMKILILVDGYDSSFVNITFGRSYFSLSALVELLENDPDYWIKYELTKAHRQNDPLGEADINGFRFTDPGFDIDDYDQVWFFGARGNINDPEGLTEAELEIVSRWMDQKQGGVFAVGDHFDLGASMCGKIPRVRTMRKWSTAQNPPQNFGPDRHDTLRRGHDNFYEFNDESDDIPMNIRVKRYPVWSVSPFKSRWAPHPLLCGKDGVISVMPDHPHEGEVIEPASHDGEINFGSYTGKPEYPNVNGSQAKPEIIAWARVQSDHTNVTDLNKGAANAKEFGAIGAYDGHRGKVGRVVVDSTWHHWMDINLIGRPRSGDPIGPVPDDDPKAFGFEHTASGRAHYAKIKNYFLNVAQWLGAPAKQNCMFMRACWGIVMRYPMAELISPKLPIWKLGGFAKDAIGRRASQCTIYSWIIPHFLEWQFQFDVELDKMEELPALSTPSWEAFETYVLGGITRQMLEFGYSVKDNRDEIDVKQVANAMAKGMSVGSSAFIDDFKSSQRRGSKLLNSVAKMSDSKFSVKSFLG